MLDGLRLREVYVEVQALEVILCMRAISGSFKLDVAHFRVICASTTGLVTVLKHAHCGRVDMQRLSLKQEGAEFYAWLLILSAFALSKLRASPEHSEMGA